MYTLARLAIPVLEDHARPAYGPVNVGSSTLSHADAHVSRCEARAHVLLAALAGAA